MCVFVVHPQPPSHTLAKTNTHTKHTHPIHTPKQTKPQIEIPKSKVELWWPAGHGAQRLYAATFAWSPAGAPAVCGEAPIYNTDDPVASAAPAPAVKKFGCSVARRNVGFRSVELVTVPLAEAAKELAPGSSAPTGADAEGESMYFRVNGVAMFLKGANLIPFDTIRTRVTDEYVKATLQGALDGEI